MAITDTDIDYMAALAFEAGERLQAHFYDKPVTPTAAVQLLQVAVLNDIRRELVDPDLIAQAVALEERIEGLRESPGPAPEFTEQQLEEFDHCDSEALNKDV